MMVTLPNGVKVIFKKTPESQTSSIGVFLEVGSCYEKEEEEGILHFIEHMFFKGTENRTSKDIKIELDYLGARFNAYTDTDIVGVYGSFAWHDVVRSSDLLFDIFLNPVFPEEELKKEKGVILEEILLREDDPETKTTDELSYKIWEGSPYGQSVIGNKENVERFTSNDLRDFYQRFLDPKKIVIICAGNIDEWLMGKIEESFGDLKGGKFIDLLPKPKTVSKRIFIEKEIKQVHFALGVSRYLPYGNSNIPYSIMNTILGRSWSSRLFSTIRDQFGLVYSVYSYFVNVYDSSYLGIYGGTSKDKIKKVIEETKKIISCIQEDITEDEIKVAKQILKIGKVFEQETSGATMHSLLADYKRYRVDKNHDEILSEINGITIEDAVDSAKRIFKGKELTILYLGAPGSIEESDYDEIEKLK